MSIKKKLKQLKDNYGKVVLWTEDTSAYATFGIEGLGDPDNCDLHEGIIRELSPSEKRVKINKAWYHIGQVRIVEVLGDADELLDLKTAIKNIEKWHKKNDIHTAVELSNALDVVLKHVKG